MKRLVHGLLAILAFIAAPAGAQEPNTYALVSAIGSTLSYVKPRFTTGSNALDGFQRAELQVPDTSLDAAALRGLERTIRETDPAARFVYLRLNPAEFEGVDAPRRGDVAVGKLATAFERMPERKQWYRIVVVTPRYVAGEREGMGSKLQGIGIYVQNHDKDALFGGGLGGGVAMGGVDAREEVKNVGPAAPGAPTRTSRYVAPYFYTRVWVLDAQTLEVVHSVERFELERLGNPSSSAIDIEDAIPPEVLGPAVESFVEQASAKAAREAVGVVTVGEPKVVKPN